MKVSSKLIAGLLVAVLCAGSAMAEVRTWTDSKGRQVVASFVQMEGENIVLKTEDGVLHKFPLTMLSSEDQAIAKASKPEAPTATAAAPAGPKATNPAVAAAAAQIDQLVANGIKRANPTRAKMGKEPITSFNALANDEQFVRRVYLDIAGRIPNYDETKAFLADANPQKRSVLIDQLLDTEGYNQHMFNYLSEMLRVKSDFDQALVRGNDYVAWLKEQVAANRPWNEMVYEMLTATGKMWDKKPDGSSNGAAGYLLRDSGMPLDNLANTLTVFLGTDVACAQCHDHPFADWTQMQFYELAAFFGATSTRMGRGMGNENLMPEIEKIVTKSGQDIQRLRNGINNYIGANRYVIQDTDKNMLRIPHDYQYKDARPGDEVRPKFVMWSSADKSNPAYKQNKSNEEGLRTSFANWLTHPENPRFAMTIANRMWKRAFGAGIAEPVTNIDDPELSTNPELLKHLASEMKRLKFNLKEFTRIILNTRAYQSEATTENIAMGEPYYFQGPMLRRMTAEQAWDSYMTMVLGQPDQYKAPLAGLYGRSMSVDLDTVDAQTVLIKYDALRKMNQKEAAMMGGGLDAAGGSMMMMDGGSDKKEADVSKEDMEAAGGKFLTHRGMRLLRAAELPQPAGGGHFLIDFGQSPRDLIDGSNKVGSVPQVLMMMNGGAQEMLTDRSSLIFRTMEKVNNPADKVEVVFLSILSRRPTLQEKDIAKSEINGSAEDGYSNMIWALINTREFMFIQ